MILTNQLYELDYLPKGIIFDCDGVLFDSKAANVKYYNLIRQAFSLPPLNREEENYVHTHSVYESLARILPDIALGKVKEVVQKLDYRQLYPYLNMAVGLIDLLLFLKRKKIRLAINTNRTNTMGDILAYYKLSSFFQPVITANKVACPKPHPESVNLILAKWKVRPREVAYIGDSVLDEECARASKVHFWSFQNPELSAELLITDFYALKGMIQKSWPELKINIEKPRLVD